MPLTDKRMISFYRLIRDVVNDTRIKKLSSLARMQLIYTAYSFI